MPQQRGVVIELDTSLAANRAAGAGRRERAARGADQPGLQRRRRDAGGRHAERPHPAHAGRLAAGRSGPRVHRSDRHAASAWTTTRGAAASSRSSPPRASAAPGWGWPWSTAWCSATAPRSRSRARRAAAPPCGSCSPAAAGDAPAAPEPAKPRQAGRASGSWSWTTTRCCSSRCATRSRSDGHDVTTADGGQAGHRGVLGRARGRARRFTLVITDLGMPYVDGRQVAAGVKAAVAGDAGDPAHRLGAAADGRRRRARRTSTGC